ASRRHRNGGTGDREGGNLPGRLQDGLQAESARRPRQGHRGVLGSVDSPRGLRYHAGGQGWSARHSSNMSRSNTSGLTEPVLVSSSRRKVPSGLSTGSTSMNAESEGTPRGVHRLSPSPSSAPASKASISLSAKSQPRLWNAASARSITPTLVRMFPWTEYTYGSAVPCRSSA